MNHKDTKVFIAAFLCAFVPLCLCGSSHVTYGATQTTPRIWDDVRLADWATPIAALNVRPGHFTSEEYYRVQADNFRTYPVYPPDREPPGYWEWLQKQKPEPLVDVTEIRSSEDWILAGERAFRELDIVTARTNDPAIIARTRDPKSFEAAFLLPDGSVSDPRWVVTDQGLMLTTSDCASCHVRVESDATLAFAGPLGPWPLDLPVPRPPGFPVTEFFARTFSRLFLEEPFGTAFWRTVAAPWAPDDRVEALRDMKTPSDLGPLFGVNTGTVPRTNGSPFHGAKVPDLHVLRFSRYLDATGTHRLRDAEDVARYAALVTAADPLEFGEHRMLTTEQRRVAYRYADEVLYAIGVYLMSLEPPRNPDPAPQPLLDSGAQIFNTQGCDGCHAPPNYTNGKLTPATGFAVALEHPNGEDVMDASVGTDPGLALQTRKGTGFYKVPSLRGLWYRPFLLHDGSVASLDEMFDARRLSPDHVPGGWKGPGVTARAIPGHPYGLNLTAGDKEALLAFLRSL
jgi:hypothetical protein